MKKHLFLIPVLISTFFINSQAQMINTTEMDALDDAIQFSVDALIPDNQIDPDVSYFHLLIEPTHHQIIKVKAINLRSEPIVIEARVHDAFTNENGVIEYSHRDADRNLMEDIVRVKEERLAFEPGESREFEFEISLEAHDFEGIMIGGLSFEMEENDKNSQDIQQAYAYNIALVLSQEDELLKSSKHLNLVEVKNDPSPTHQSFVVSLENDEPRILSDLKLTVRIYKHDTQELIFESVNSNLEIAPRSILNYRLKLGRINLQAGTYIYDIEADSFSQNWHWNAAIEVGEVQGEALKEKSKNQHFISVIAIVLFSVIVLVSVKHRTKRSPD